MNRSDEYIDHNGHLRVPVPNAGDPTPKREGWEPYFVSVLLEEPIQKVVTYKRTGDEEPTRQRTDHTVRINTLREVADDLQRSYEQTGSVSTKELFLSTRAAADLLEIHDATGLNLHNAPALLEFVEHFMGGTVDPNGA